jgi:hypothetical protein
VGRERKAQVGLGEGGDNTTKRSGHIGGKRRVSFDGNEGTFMKVNGEASGSGEIIKQGLKISHVIRDSPNDNKSVICILEDRTREVINQRVQEKPSPRSMKKQLLEDISNDIEKERRKRITLPKAAPALDPTPQNTVKKHRSLTSGVKHLDPLAPELGEALGQEDSVKSIPTDRIKGLAEV